ncbi:hypothetical protein G9A89_009019 [Geosiphon pyriformis]|nr:hypothetical protein G9A89_009019 [Geosiphon pyriformis]
MQYPKLSQQVQIIGDNLKLKIQLLEVQPHPENVNSQQISINNITEKRPKTSETTQQKQLQSGNHTRHNNSRVLPINLHPCKQRFNIPDRIEVVKKSVYQYIENHINNYLFGNYNISEVRSNLYNNLAHYSQLGTEDLNSKTLAIYFHELNFNIIKYCEETYSVQSQYTIDFESEIETSNKGKNKLKQYSKTTSNTPTLPKTTAKHLQTPKQGTTANEKNNSKITEEESIDSENEENEMTTYITKIPEFNGEDIETSPQEWLDQVTKAGDANGWNAARMLRTIPYFLKGTAGEWFENLVTPFNDWNAFKAAFFEQFTDNNTSITLCNHFRNIKQELSEFIMTYIGKFNKLLRWIRQLETNNYYSDAQILDQFIAGLKDKLIKKVCPHAPEDLNSAIQHAKRYEMAMEEANHTKLVNLAIGETSSAAEEKIDQLTKKVENYFTNQQQQQPQRYQPPQRRNQNNFAPLSNNQPQNCHYCGISGHWKKDCRKLQRDQQNRDNQCYSPPQQSYYQPSLPAYYPPRSQYQNNYYQPAPQPIQQQYQQPPTQHYQLTISYQGQHAWVPAICGTFNKRSEKTPAFEFELEEEKPIIKTFMALGSMSNWADETEQEHFTSHTKPETSRWNIPYSKPESRKQCPYIPLKCKDCHKKLSSMEACISPEEEYENHTCYYCKACHRDGKWDNTPCLTCGDMLLEECNWIDVVMRGGVCNQTCQYALSISEKVKRGTPFNAAYNSAFNKLYHYLHDAEMIFDLAIALINRATKKDVRQIKEAEYIKYTIELAGFNYEDEVEVYHQIAKQMNIRLCEECIMPCNEQWCPECYALSILLPSKNDENEIEFGEPEEIKKIETTPIYLIENQPALQLKYFNNNGQGIQPEKAHEIDVEYDLRYPGKDILVLKPKSLTKINLKIALKILPGAMVQIASWSSLTSKEINVRRGIINAGYTRDITIKHAEKIAQAIYLPLINISGLQLVNQREQLRKSNRGIQGFGSTGRFIVPVNIALNTQNKSHQILRLLQLITISPFGEHPEIYICPKSTTTQQIFESNEQVCLKHNILIPNIYIPEGTKKV